MQDVTLIGSGLVGAAMAIALAQQGLRVQIVDAVAEEARLDAGYDGRTAAISYGSRRILDSIGVWSAVEDPCPIYDIRVADQDSRAHVHYHYRDAGEDPFGHIVENRYLRRALYNAMKAQPLITLHAPAKPAAIRQDTAAVEVLLDNGETLRSSLLVVADGKFSATRQMLGIEARVTEYGQTAIVCTIAHSEPHHGLAVERFLPAGPFALLPMSGNRTNIVWTERDAMAAHLLSLPEAELLEEVKRRAGAHLDELSLVGARYSYPLKLIRAERMIAPRTALVGDAAHAIHPIAGQGVNLGYRDVAALRDCIVEQARLGMDIGSQLMLKHYAQQRRFDVASMAHVTDGLNRLFSNNLPPLRAARDAGLGLVNQLMPAKRMLMRHAMGMIGSTPALMRKEAS